MAFLGIRITWPKKYKPFDPLRDAPSGLRERVETIHPQRGGGGRTSLRDQRQELEKAAQESFARGIREKLRGS